MDLFNNVGNVVRILSSQFNVAKHKNFNFDARVNDYARITLLTSQYSNMIRPFSSNELAARTNQIELWVSQEIGNLETKLEEVKILNITECKSRFPKTENIWQALDQSEKGEIETLICVEHKGKLVCKRKNHGTN